jgi:hypothetical protein
MKKPIENLSPEQLETFAAGLYHLSNVDGVSPEEQEQLKAFLEKQGTMTLFERLPFSSFDPKKAALILDSEWIRHAFFRAALDIVRADGVVNDIERDALHWLLGYLPCSISSIQELEDNKEE